MTRTAIIMEGVERWNSWAEWLFPDLPPPSLAQWVPRARYARPVTLPLPDTLSGWMEALAWTWLWLAAAQDAYGTVVALFRVWTW